MRINIYLKNFFFVIGPQYKRRELNDRKNFFEFLSAGIYALRVAIYHWQTKQLRYQRRNSSQAQIHARNVYFFCNRVVGNTGNF